MIKRTLSRSVFSLCATVAILLICSLDLAAQTPYLVKDINPGVSGNCRNPSYLTAVGSRVYFALGGVLWTSDGTPSGTKELRDLNMGSDLSIHGNLTNLDGHLVFTTRGVDGVSKLWKSDGTAAGTVLLSPPFCYPADIKVINGKWYFVAQEANNGYVLWKSDGTPGSAVKVRTFDSPISILQGSTSGMIFLQEQTYTQSTKLYTYSLWKSDGTQAGTAKLKEFTFSGINSSISCGGELLFTTLYQLWKSDGTEAGTVVLKDYVAHGTSRAEFISGSFGEGSALIVSDNELWKYDGPISGTKRIVAMVEPIETVTTVDNTIFIFTAQSLWKSDGTSQGTACLKTFKWYSRYYQFDKGITSANGLLIFAADDGIHGIELWESDGTAASTVLLKDTIAGPGSGAPTQLTNADGTVYFVADHLLFGQQLWKSDGTTTGTVVVESAPGSSSPQLFSNVNGKAFFFAYDSQYGMGLWKSEGTEGSTLRIKTVSPCAGTRYNWPHNYYLDPKITDIGGILYFAGDDGVHGCEPWRSDGTPAGTYLLKDIRIGPEGAFVQDHDRQDHVEPTFVNLKGQVVFSAQNETGLFSLWISDGTQIGTKPIVLTGVARGYRAIDVYVSTSNTLFFVTGDGSEAMLWKSDGTSAGTALVKVLQDYDFDPSQASNFTDIDGILYFRLRYIDPEYVYRDMIWKSDGTDAGTSRVDQYDGWNLNPNNHVGVFKDSFFFICYERGPGKSTVSMWRFDLLTMKHYRIMDFNRDNYIPYDKNIYVVNGEMYITIRGAHSYELWKSDGTSEGTVMIREGINFYNETPSFTAIGGYLYFFTSGELWSSDGTAAGTKMIMNIGTVYDDAIQNHFAVVGTKVLFSHYEKETGAELWAIETSGCMVSCLAEAPSSGLVDVPASFSAAVGTGSCSGTPSYAWDFGDGTAGSSDAAPKHTYTKAGIYTWNVTVTIGAQSCTKSGTITIRETPPIEAAGTYTCMIPSSAHSGGASGSNWKTDAVLHNPKGEDTMAYLYFLQKGQDNSSAVGQKVLVPAGQSLKLVDVVSELFHESDASGAILIGSMGELLITSRTYNTDVHGTYGQLFEGVPVTQAIVNDQKARLLQLRAGEFRTNIGFANASGVPFVATVTLHTIDGSFESQKSVSISPWGYVQLNNIVSYNPYSSSSYAVITSTTPNARYFTYASVVDNRTNDPMEIMPVNQSSLAYVPGVAHTAGYFDTNWMTDVDIHNPWESEVDIAIEFLLRDPVNTSYPDTLRLKLRPGQIWKFRDILGMFAQLGADKNYLAGTLRVSSTGEPVMAASRTYNQQPTGTYGQFIPAFPESEAIPFGAEARLIGLSRSLVAKQGFRSNIGLVNVTDAAIDVEMAFYKGDGRYLGSRTYPLGAYESIQRNNAFIDVSGEDIPDGYVVLRTVTPNGRFIAYASVVDGRSGDPFYVPARIVTR